MRIAKKNTSSSEWKKINNQRWYRFFKNENVIQSLAAGQIIRPKLNCGLIYVYYTGGCPRYVGQTRQTLKNRLLLRDKKSGFFGYNHYIKSKILKAIEENAFQIKTREVAEEELNNIEQKTIEHFGAYWKLWNKEHNADWQKENYKI